ncbi:DedA family protein [Candidatus Microgenomates bacterium]|nr:DedA family protein [Candidatus Microgenomates bacterium]
MQILKTILDFFLHIDKNLFSIVQQFGAVSYIILFAVIFMETGLVVTPFLPGDSLIFAAGALAGGKALNIVLLFGILLAAAFVGDTVNYWIGHFIGPKVFEANHKLLKKEYLEKAQKFYEKHGGKAIVLARFVPIVRTFAPFVAGIGQMSYPHFLMFNLLGGFLWVSLFLFTGFFFGNLPIVKENFHYTVIVIVLISIVPIFIEWYKAKKEISHS